jgi:hypothetical protein
MGVVRATNASIRSLRKAGRLREEDRALVALVETTAAILEQAVKEGAPLYAVAKSATVHLQSLVVLLNRCPAPPVKDPAMTALEAAFQADPWG